MQQFLTTKDNIRIAYEVHGDESAPPILLVMGLGMPSAAWPQSFIEGLVRQGLRVIVFDNRDSGYSTKINENVGKFRILRAIFRTLRRKHVSAPYSLEDMAADAEAVLDTLEIKRAHVLGVSMGGMIAQVMALNYPQRVASLISVMSASGNPSTGLGSFGAIRALLKKPSREDDVDCVVRYFKAMFKAIGSPQGSYDEELIRRVATSVVESGYQFSAASRQLLAILASGDRSKTLCRIISPTLVIHGRKDPLLPFKAGEEVAGNIPNSRMLGIDGMGHDLPDRVTEIIVKEVAKHCHRYKE